LKRRGNSKEETNAGERYGQASIYQVSVKIKKGQAKNKLKFWLSRFYFFSKIDRSNLDCRIIDLSVPVRISL
jgi:hypothetical protein